MKIEIKLTGEDVKALYSSKASLSLKCPKQPIILKNSIHKIMHKILHPQRKPFILTGFLFIYFIIFFPLKNKNLDLLIISVDTLRHDFCNEFYMPNTISFFKNSFEFENAYAPVPSTLPSHICLFTGFPFQEILNEEGLVESSLTIAEFLKEKGYKTAAYVSGFPLSHEFKINQGFDIYEDNFIKGQDTMYKYIEKWGGKACDVFDRRADYTIALFLKEWQKKEKKPRFFFLHLYDPHEPYMSDKYSIDYTPFKVRDRKEINYIKKAYSEEVRFVDKQLKGVYESIDLNKTIVIFTSDHGENLCDHDNYLTHNEVVYETTIKVPLFIKIPKLKGKKILTPVSILDIFSTAISLLGFEPTQNFGINLKGLILNGEEIEKRLFFAESHGEKFGACGSVFDGKWKFIARGAEEKLLFFIPKDKNEKNNLIERYPERAEKMHKILEKWWKCGRRVDPIKFLNINDERKRAFKALGYLN